MTDKFFWPDWWAEVLSELLMGQDVEELAKILGKAPNTVACWTYKSKSLNVPNAEQLGQTLDFVNRTNPAAVRRFLRKLAARFGAVAGSRSEVLGQLAQEAAARDRGPGQGSKDERVIQFRFPQEV
jgi:hypothetical protein